VVEVDGKSNAKGNDGSFAFMEPNVGWIDAKVPFAGVDDQSAYLTEAPSHDFAFVVGGFTSIVPKHCTSYQCFKRQYVKLPEKSLLAFLATINRLASLLPGGVSINFLG